MWRNCSTGGSRNWSCTRNSVNSNRCAAFSARQEGRDAHNWKGRSVNNIIYIIGLVVVVIAVLSFFGLR